MASVERRLFNVFAGVALGVCVVSTGLWLFSDSLGSNGGFAPTFELPGWRLEFSLFDLHVSRRVGQFDAWGFDIAYDKAAFFSAILPAVWLIARNWRRLRTPSGSRRAAGIIGCVASIVCGWQVIRLIMWGIYGAPPDPLHPIALLGAVGLFFTSVAVLLSSGRMAYAASLISVVPLWIFYGPASVAFIVGGGLVADPTILLPPLLLLVATVMALLNLTQRPSIAF